MNSEGFQFLKTEPLFPTINKKWFEVLVASMRVKPAHRPDRCIGCSFLLTFNLNAAKYELQMRERDSETNSSISQESRFSVLPLRAKLGFKICTQMACVFILIVMNIQGFSVQHTLELSFRHIY